MDDEVNDDVPSLLLILIIWVIIQGVFEIIFLTEKVVNLSRKG